MYMQAKQLERVRESTQAIRVHITVPSVRGEVGRSRSRHGSRGDGTVVSNGNSSHQDCYVGRRGSVEVSADMVVP